MHYAITALEVLWWALAVIFAVLLLTGSIGGWVAWAYVGVTAVVATVQRMLKRKLRQLEQQ